MKFTTLFLLVLSITFFIAFDTNRTIDKLIFPSLDKIKHLIAFFTLSFFLMESTIPLKKYIKILLLISIAIFIETFQFIIGRELSLLDLCASIFGIFLYIFISFSILKLNKNFH